MLAKGYAFQREGVDVSDASANTLTGTVTVVPLPLHFAEQPQNAYITYGQSAVLKVEVLGGANRSRQSAISGTRWGKTAPPPSTVLPALPAF